MQDKDQIPVFLTQEQLTYLVEILEENSDCSYMDDYPRSTLWCSIWGAASDALEKVKASRA